MTKQFTRDQIKELTKARHGIGLYSILELAAMFNCSRYYIDYGINTNKLEMISPNNRDRFVYLRDFEEYMAKYPDKGLDDAD